VALRQRVAVSVLAHVSAPIPTSDMVPHRHQKMRNPMLNDATNPPPEPPDQTPPDPDPEYPLFVVEPGTMSGRMALIRALARILVRLDRAALAVSQSPTPTMPDESIILNEESTHDPE
jgi:hypothetical protein